MFAKLQASDGTSVEHANIMAQAWSECVSFGAFEAYRNRFESIQQYFAPRFPDAVRLGNEMIKEIMTKSKK
jgi:prephenate dehydrogenase (NADP+)